MPNPLPPERVWRDPEVVKTLSDPTCPLLRIEGTGRPLRLGTAASALQAVRDCRRYAIPGLAVPYCLVHGVQDLGVPVGGSDYLWSAAATPPEDRRYLRIEGAKHDVLADPCAEEAVEFAMEFVRRRTSGETTSGSGHRRPSPP
jgi:alpha-beta hydrolase superfamily lysophospholipase